MEEVNSSSSCIGQLRYLFQASEISVLHSYLQTDEYWSKLQENSAEASRTEVETQMADMTLADSPGKKLGLEEHNGAVSRKVYCGLPQSNRELITTLSCYLDNLGESTAAADGQMGAISCLADPHKLLEEIVLQLEERDEFKEDIRSIRCKIPTHNM